MALFKYLGRFVVLGLVLSSAASARSTPSQPAVVRFSNLLWVYAQGGLPRVTTQGTVVPLLEMCDLFAAKCNVAPAGEQARLESKGRRFMVPLERERGVKSPYALLKNLAVPLGFRYVWDPRSHTVDIIGTNKTPNGLSKIKGLAYGFSGPATVPTTPVTASSTLTSSGFVGLKLSLASTQRTTLTVFAKALNGTWVTTGDAVRSSVDVKNPGNSCKTTLLTQCNVTFNPLLYALAVLSWVSP